MPCQKRYASLLDYEIAKNLPQIQIFQLKLCYHLLLCCDIKSDIGNAEIYTTPSFDHYVHI